MRRDEMIGSKKIVSQAAGTPRERRGRINIRRTDLLKEERENGFKAQNGCNRHDMNVCRPRGAPEKRHDCCCIAAWD